MNKDKQREIWKKHHGYAGESRKWAYRRSKRAIRALLAEGWQPGTGTSIHEAKLAGFE